MYIFIVNPIAGNGKAKKIYDTIRHLPLLQNEAKFYITEYKGHINEIIAEIQLTKRTGIPIEILFVIGGDGTVHEVVNALTDHDIRICYIPGGSGNDFSRGINGHKQPREIIERAINEQQEKTYWIGTYVKESNSHDKFLNSIGFGFDAAVVKRASTLPIRKLLSLLKLNQLIYLFALLRELISYKPREITIRYDDHEIKFSRVLFATISNQPYMGGGMKVNPDAHNNKENFSILVVDSISKWKVFFLFGTVFFGKHTMFKEVHTFKAKEISIMARDAIPFQADGEYGEIKTTVIKKYNKPIIIKGTKSTM